MSRSHHRSDTELLSFVVLVGVNCTQCCRRRKNLKTKHVYDKFYAFAPLVLHLASAFETALRRPWNSSDGAATCRMRRLYCRSRVTLRLTSAGSISSMGFPMSLKLSGSIYCGFDLYMYCLQ